MLTQADGFQDCAAPAIATLSRLLEFADENIRAIDIARPSTFDIDPDRQRVADISGTSITEGGHNSRRVVFEC
jgi:hypothetical protein